MKRLVTLMLVTALALCHGGHACAQAFGASPPPPPAFGKDNKDVSAIIQLQYQMQLLKRLIERETVASNMVKAAIDIGVANPVVPKPDRELCTQIPANIPCATAYTDLYPGYSVKPETHAVKLLPIEPVLPKEAEKTVEAAVAPFQETPLYWTDITCLNKKCSAVISSTPNDPASRYRVNVGEKLPDGGVVSAISASGVTLQRGKKAVKVEPAPTA